MWHSTNTARGSSFATKDSYALAGEKQIKKLLEAALEHDAACYVETREEHAGLRPVGTTP